jgi:hypothetical protein
MKFFKHTLPLVLGLLLMAGSAVAQGQQMQSAQPDTITDEELEKVAAISSEAREVQMESRQKLQQEVEASLADKEMDMQRFQQIMMSRQNPQTADSVNVTKQEEATIKEIQPRLMKIQQKSQKQMMGIMQENDMNMQRFRQVMQAIQSDKELQQRFMEISKESQN